MEKHREERKEIERSVRCNCTEKGKIRWEGDRERNRDRKRGRGEREIVVRGTGGK